MFTGEDVTAQRAYELGLVQKCVPTEKLMDACMELAQKIAARAPKSMTAIKKVIHTSRQGIFGGSMLTEQEQNFLCAASKDIGEGLAALREKRQPVFKNE